MAKLTAKDVENQIAKEIDFELKFYSYIAGQDRFEVFPIPMMDGTYLTDEDKEIAKADCRSKNINLVYRVSHGSFATVFCPGQNLIGIVPEDDPRGFHC